MKRKILIFTLLAFLLVFGCGRRQASPLPISDAEKALIMDSDSLMRVLSIFDRDDSLVLRTKSTDFTDKDLQSDVFKTLAGKLLFTVRDSSQDGVGIAGPQVGINRRVVAVQRFDLPGEPFGVYPNIRVDSLWGGKVPGPEGCLSVPGWRGIVPRYDHVIVSYKDPSTLETVRDTVEGFTAVIFQHETDHLEGVLYIDKADSLWADGR